jgi:hypothetical protein
MHLNLPLPPFDLLRPLVEASLDLANNVLAGLAGLGGDRRRVNVLEALAPMSLMNKRVDLSSICLEFTL